MKTTPRFAIRLLSSLSLVFFLTLNIAHAQTVGSEISNLLDFINKYVVALIFAVAFVAFLWGVFQYFIMGGGSEEKRAEGRTFVIYGIIGFAIMLSVWGLVNLLDNSFGFSSTTRPPLPTFPATGSSGSTGQSPSFPTTGA